MAASSLLKLKAQLATKPVPFAKSRLILYFCLFIFSVLSGFLYLVSVIHEPRTNYEKNQRFSDHQFVALALVPLSWSAVWSYIVLRTLLVAIDHNAPAPAIPTPDTTAEDPQQIPVLPAPRRSRLAPKASEHRASRCCCCTCTPWFPREIGPHPVFALCIDLVVLGNLCGMGSVFGILMSSATEWPSPLASEAWNWASYLDDCPKYEYGTDILYYTCTADWRALLAMDSLAAIFLLFAIFLNMATLVINGRLVHRWRGEMGLRRSKRGKRFDRTGRGEGEDVEDRAQWVEMPKMSTESRPESLK